MTFERTGVHIVAAVTGTGTGLGHFTEVLDYVLAYDFVNFAGGGSITAADGSQLFLSFSGAIPGFAAQVFPLPYSAAYTIAPTATVRQRHASAFSAASDDSSIPGVASEGRESRKDAAAGERRHEAAQLRSRHRKAGECRSPSLRGAEEGGAPEIIRRPLEHR